MSSDLALATHIEVDADVRYWEDATVNGVTDIDGSLIFGRDPNEEGNVWRVRIDLAEGRVEGWPADMQANIHYKVCDAGLYWLLNSGGDRIARWKGHYPPCDFLTHGSSPHSDYIVLSIYPGGQIGHYTQPSIKAGEWELIGPRG